MFRGLLFCIIIVVVIHTANLNVFADSTSSTLRPTTDGGDDSADWLNSGSIACNGTDCYLDVDEESGANCTSSDGDTSYIESSSNGANQTFDIDESSVPNGAIITQIDITVCAVRGAGGAKIETRRCIDDTCTNSGTNFSPSASYGESTQSHTGLSITKGASTDIEIGVSNGASKTVRVSQISATITYDNTAPATVSDLSSSNVGDTSVTLTWVAPGDDGSTGTATTYDIRYSTANITDANWSSVTQASGEPTPSVAGTNETLIVTGLTSETTYYFAIKTSDEAPNESGLSNIYSVTTDATPDTNNPGTVNDLTTSNPTSNSVDISWTSTGDDGDSGTATTYDVRYATANITDANWSTATQATGEPTPKTASSSESMTISGLTQNTEYFFGIKVLDEAQNESGLSNIPSLTTSEASDNTDDTTTIQLPTSGGVAPSRVFISGQAYPGSTVEILQKGSLDNTYKNIPVETALIDEKGNFSVEYLGLLGADYLFALRIVDKVGEKTGIISFGTNLTTTNLLVDNLYLPPTISFEKSIISRGKNVEIKGFATPESTVELYIDGIKQGEAKPESDGFYKFSTSTTNYSLGVHPVRVLQRKENPNAQQTSVLIDQNAVSPYIKSNYSLSRIFRITELSNPKADFNNDNKINITDWSIFLSRWGSKDKNVQLTVDFDLDGNVSITDLSIFLNAMKS